VNAPPLAGRAAAGVVWTLAASLATRAVSLASLMLLARLLAPEDYGLLASALVYLTYAETASDLGTGAALVYWRGSPAEAAQAAFIVGLVMGWVWFALTVACAPAVAAYFDSPETEAVLRTFAWIFPIKALGLAHDALCRKALRFRARFVPELGMAAVKAGVSVALALGGLGVWALVWGQIAGTAAWTMLLWRVSPWRPALRLPRAAILSMLRYGRGIVAVNILAAVTHHADLVVVGRVLGTAALGFYQIAYKVPELTLLLLSREISTVVFPALARIGAERGDVRAAYLAALRLVSLLALPAGAAMAVLAEPLVLVLFGAEWRPATPILRALAAYSGFRAVGAHAGDVLKATGRPHLLATLGLLKAAILLPALVLAAPAGPAAVAAAMATVAAGTMLLNLGAIGRVERVSARALAAAVRPGIAVAAVVGGALAAWQRIAGAPSAAALAAGVVIGALAYAGAVRIVCAGLWTALRGARAARRRPAASGRAPAAAGLAERP
jgi:PST family polysaccharide transporter